MPPRESGPPAPSASPGTVGRALARWRARWAPLAADLARRPPVAVVLRTSRYITERGSWNLAAAASFYTLLAFQAMLVAVLALLALLDLSDRVGEFLVLLHHAFPAEVAEPLERELGRLLAAGSGEGVLFSLLLATWSASRVFAALLAGLGMPRDGRIGWERWRWRLVGMAITLAGVLVVVFLLAVLGIGQAVVGWLADHGWLPAHLLALYAWSRWPVVFLVFQQSVTLLYLAAGIFPRGLRWRRRWWSTGSLVATVLWVVETWAYGWYVRNVVDLGATYGSMSGAVGFLLYLFVTYGMLMLVGQWERARQVQRRREAAAG